MRFSGVEEPTGETPSTPDKASIGALHGWLPISSASAAERVVPAPMNAAELIPAWAYSTPAVSGSVFRRGIGRASSPDAALNIAFTNATRSLQDDLQSVAELGTSEAETLLRQHHDFHRYFYKDGEDYVAMVLLEYESEDLSEGLQNLNSLGPRAESRAKIKDAVKKLADRGQYVCHFRADGWGPELSAMLQKWNSLSDFYIGDGSQSFNLKPDKVASARNSMQVSPTDKIVAQIDATVLGSAVNGVLFGENDLYYRNGVANDDPGGRFSYPQLFGQEIAAAHSLFQPFRVAIGREHDILLSGSSISKSKLEQMLHAIQAAGRARCELDVPGS
jgi:hypothetical protein